MDFIKSLLGLQTRTEKAQDRLATSWERMADKTEALEARYSEVLGIVDIAADARTLPDRRSRKSA